MINPNFTRGELNIEALNKQSAASLHTGGVKAERRSKTPLHQITQESETLKGTLDSATAGDGRRIVQPEISEVDLEVDCQIVKSDLRNVDKTLSDEAIDEVAELDANQVDLRNVKKRPSEEITV